MEELKSLTSSSSKLYFTKLIRKYESKTEVIVTFLALLELIKLKTVKVIQEKNFYDIYIERIEDSE